MLLSPRRLPPGRCDADASGTSTSQMLTLRSVQSSAMPGCRRTVGLATVGPYQHAHAAIPLESLHRPLSSAMPGCIAHPDIMALSYGQILISMHMHKRTFGTVAGVTGKVRSACTCSCALGVIACHCTPPGAAPHSISLQGQKFPGSGHLLHGLAKDIPR